MGTQFMVALYASIKNITDVEMALNGKHFSDMNNFFKVCRDMEIDVRDECLIYTPKQFALALNNDDLCINSFFIVSVTIDIDN